MPFLWHWLVIIICVGKTSWATFNFFIFCLRNVAATYWNANIHENTVYKEKIPIRCFPHSFPWWIKIWLYFFVLIFSSVLSTPLTEMQPQCMTEPPPHFKVGCRHLQQWFLTNNAKRLDSLLHQTCFRWFFSDSSCVIWATSAFS